ncbi:hypothetical protein M231_00264 [Tremella mesenterica]|uniref:WW domain-containing protein n=1 Tax=Tremella mesenterica TaxID=5217 RepID=A0A4Q1BVU5_TREME|nr:uncharacterized protein TREMEDRAFT_74275 [Tremella mesenterica DSM 1558]EIW68415.1 hypothetical protein TREMEDRAFT_74275 [Tremella mesenterica DSM 1558]RXK42274.1 hypothetical protein M231_00264 [Tremella mesenterica]
MPDDSPPSYQTTMAQPALNITSPSGVTHPANSDPALANTGPVHRPSHNRADSDASSMSDISDASEAGLTPGLVDEEGRRSMDDEQRELPQGWVRCFDPKTEHHFYVDVATKRSTWLHPYDDPEYLRTLPDTHPAHPNSAEASAMRKRAEDEALMVEEMKAAKDKNPKGSSSLSPKDNAAGPSVERGANPDGTHPWDNAQTQHRNWLQKKKDQLIGTKEERQKAKEEKRKMKEEARKRRREQEEEYLRRRQELLKRQMNDPNIRAYYASDPFGYAAPAGPYSRSGGLYSNPYGYGYSGGYGRRYGYNSYGGYGGYGGYGYGGGLGGGGLLLGGGAGLLGGLLIGDALAGGGGF